MITDPAKDYARGFVPFLGAQIFLDSHPLIPRVETEFWAEKAIAQIPPHAKVLDLFAGSGAIGIAILTHIPDATVDFGEIESRHFPIIEKSIQQNNIDPNRTRMLQTDVWTGIADRYDLIVANPPYIAERSTALAESVAAHEPHEALFAEDEGFAYLEETVRGAAAHLQPHGTLWLEHDPAQTPRIALLADALGLEAATHTDQFGVARYTVAYCRT